MSTFDMLNRMNMTSQMIMAAERRDREKAAAAKEARRKANSGKKDVSNATDKNSSFNYAAKKTASSIGYPKGIRPSAPTVTSQAKKVSAPAKKKK